MAVFDRSFKNRLLRETGSEGIGNLNSFHAKKTMLALRLLYIFVIPPLESSTSQKEVDEKLVEAFQTTVQSAAPEQQRMLGEALYATKPVLNRFAQTYSKPDSKQKELSKDVFIRAGIIPSFLGSYSLSKPEISRATCVVRNLVIFAIMYMFFQFVAKKNRSTVLHRKRRLRRGRLEKNANKNKRTVLYFNARKLRKAMHNDY